MNYRLISPDLFKGHIIAFFTGKEPGANLDSISRTLNIKKESIFLPIQKHTDKIIIVDSSLEPKVADAVITSENGVLIGVQVADCVPILIYEKERGVVAAVHAGWRSTADEILKKTLETMIGRFTCKADNILVAMGPSIRWCCYEVDLEVLNAVQQATGEGEYYQRKGEKYCLDLPLANKYQAMRMDIPEKNIWISDECTFCYPDRFYSYRYANGPTGRQGGFIGKI
jgi:YfiH family protein